MRKTILLLLVLGGCAPQPEPTPSPTPSPTPTVEPTPFPTPSPTPFTFEDVDWDVWTETLLTDVQMAETVESARVGTKSDCEATANLVTQGHAAVLSGSSLLVQRPDGLWEEYNPWFNGVWAKANE